MHMVEVSQSDDPTVLRSAIHKVADAAGLADEFSCRGDSQTGLGAILSDSSNFAHSSSTREVSALSSKSIWGPMPSGMERQSILPTQDADPVVAHDFGQQQSGCMTFRLDCGLLTFPSGLSRMLEPPLDIAPYLGPNQQTLAARIYWYCTETTVSLVYQLTGHDPGKVAFAAQNHPVLADMLRYVSTSCSYNYLLALAEARLEFYRVGSCKADNLAATRDSALLLRQRVEQVHDAEGYDLEEWSTATAVARIVEDKLSGRALRRLEAAVRNDGTDVEAEKLLKVFIHSFWFKSTCLGDGPRWKASYIDERAAWLIQALS